MDDFAPARWQNRCVYRFFVLSVVLLGCSFLASPASAAISFTRCPGKPRLECAELPVPIDRAGAVPGAVTLHLERQRARGRSTGVIVGLSGGPGQAGVPFLEDFADEVEPALRNHDLIVFDQRGTGRSGALDCSGLEGVPAVAPGLAIERCAQSLGPRRAFYTAADSADDIEAIRTAIGASRVSLYGSSYGTKVALAYASRYPNGVDRVLLDSVLPLDRPELLLRESFAAVPRVLRDLCRRGACAGITGNPVADVARLVGRLRTRPLRGRVVGGDGRLRARRLGRVRLFNVLVDGDVDSSFRAEFPAAVKSAVRGDSAPLLRLAHRAAVFDAQDAAEPVTMFSPAMHIAATCEEATVPWDPAAPVRDRWGQANAYLRSQQQAAFAPFDRETAWRSGLVPLCVHWPKSRRAFPAAPIPNVPILMLSGAEDVRTPAETAAALAARVPSATQLVLPGVGHGVIGTDLSFCSYRAAARFFAGRTVTARCPRQGQVLRELTTFFLRPTPVPPTSLAQFPRRGFGSRGLGPRAARTLQAFQLTIADALLQQLYWCFYEPCPKRMIGGLRRGRIGLNGKLHRYSLVPGTWVSDSDDRYRDYSFFRARPRRFEIGGRAASAGFLTIDPKSLTTTGVLAGEPVRVDLEAELEKGLEAGRSSGGRELATLSRALRSSRERPRGGRRFWP